MDINFNELQGIKRKDGFTSYCGTTNYYDSNGDKIGELIIDVPKERFENGELVSYEEVE